MRNGLYWSRCRWRSGLDGTPAAVRANTRSVVSSMPCCTWCERAFGGVKLAAGVRDSAGAFDLLARPMVLIPTIQVVYADGGYRGKLLTWARDTPGITLKIVKRIADMGFQVLPKRWVAEGPTDT